MQVVCSISIGQFKDRALRQPIRLFGFESDGCDTITISGKHDRKYQYGN